MAYQNEKLCWFLECFPTCQLHSKPQSLVDEYLWVFSSKDEEGSERNSCSYSDKVISAFSKLKIDIGCIVQLWAPLVTIDGRLLLSTCRQPFAVSGRLLDENLVRYRKHCVEYGYMEQDEDQRPKILSNGPPLSAFFSRLAEMLIINTSVHREAGPLLRYGYEECELKTSWMMPIFDPSRNSSSSNCIGVVECSDIDNSDLQLFNLMREALEKVGLRAFNVQHHIPYKTISGLKHTKEQIQEALETICESHDIFLAQVWISYEDDNHEHLSSSLMGPQMKQMLALKLTGYISFDEKLDRLSDNLWGPILYYNACDMKPLKMGNELVLKTFQDYKPRFYKDNSKLGTDILLAELTVDTKCSGLTICMSDDTGDYDYAFEFMWWPNSDYVMFLEALLFTLKRHLPCFKCASGAELGDELYVIDVDNSTKSETKTFKISQGNISSPTAEAMEKGKKAMVVDYEATFKAKRDTTEIRLSREQIEQQYGKTIKVAAEALGVSVSTLKRKRNQLGMGGWPEQKKEANKSKKNKSSQSQTNKKCNEAIEDPSPVNRNENTLIIKVKYADHMIKFENSISEATFDTIEKEIGVKFKLGRGTYWLKYLDGEDWISLFSNEDMIYYMETLRSSGETEARLSVFMHKQ